MRFRSIPAAPMIAAVATLIYAGVRSQAAAPGASSRAMRVEAGISAPFSVERPAGRAVVTVRFPTPYHAPPVVVVSIASDASSSLTARVAATSPSGFQAIVSTPVFVHENAANGALNWIAAGE